MSIAEFCIRRPVFTMLLMAAIMVGGLAGYRSLPVSALPRVDFPTIQVSANLPGASPETMASSVATPLEREFSTIAGVTSMTSSSFLGNTTITLQFDLDRDIDGAALDVQTAISATQRRLPSEMTTPPSFRKVNPADQPILFIAVSSETLPITQVNDYADTMMAQRISTIPGVAQVLIYGQQKYAVRTQVYPDRMAAAGISMEQVRSSLGAAASNAPVGVISGPKQLFNLQVDGQPSDAAGFRDLVALWRDGAPVRLGDIATVLDDVEDNRSRSFINGKQAVVIAIQRQPDANTIEVVERVRALLPVFRSQLPASVELTPMFDRSVSVRDSVHDVQFTLILTIGLVIAVIYAFLRNARATIIPALAVPLSIIATYGCMALFDFSLNNVSLLAITLCVGLVVDDAIVMLENIMRHVEEGMPPFEAAIVGAKEINFTIISTSLSLVAVFIPVLFMGGIIGRLFSEFAVTISVAILASAVISLTLTPMMCSRWLRVPSKHSTPGTTTAKPDILERSFAAMLNAYERTLTYALHHRKLVMLATAASLVASIVMFAAAPKGFFPLEDNGFVFGSTEAAQDISFEAMVVKQKQMAELIAANPHVDNVFYAVGGGRGTYNSGRMFFGLKPRSERPPIGEVIAQIRKSASSIEGMAIYMQPVQNMQIGGRQSKSLYQYTLQGNDLDTLYKYSDLLLQALQKEQGFLDVTTDLQLQSLQAMVTVDQAKAASLGVSYEAVRQLLYSAYGNAQVATLFTPSNDYAVLLEVAPEFQQNPESIGSLYVSNDRGEQVPLSTIATVARGVGPLSINHQGQLPSVTLSFNLAPNMALSNAVERINAIKKKLEMPESIISAFQGNAQVFQDSSNGQGLLIIIAIAVIYIILGMLYESFIHPITILSGLPSAGLGALIVLMLFGMEVSVIAIVGIILLVGIVKKNAIMMIDFAITARDKGMSAEDAIFQACIIRFRPIMMTTMTAIFGALPIALGIGAGAELRQPLGISIVGGLLTSQFLTLYITPVVYLYLDKWSSRRHSESQSVGS
jgi:hydrophobic/amphiphilic exporter-1 (mainly G- bacteria), HAE1 family